MEARPQSEGGYRLKASQYVGTVQLPGNVTIRIQPKIGIPNFLRLLNYVYQDLPILFDQTAHFQQVDELIDYLTRVFVTKVEELYRTSYRRSYFPLSEDLAHPRGRPKVRETLHYARSFKSRIFCEYDEFTGDILINRIIKFANFLLLSYKREAITSKLQYLYSLFDDVALEQITLDQLNGLVYDRLTEPYRRVHQRARATIHMRRSIEAFKIEDIQRRCGVELL